MQLEELSNISDNLAMMPDPALQQFAQMHKQDPYMVSLALSESNRRKAIRTAAQGQAGAAPQPKVVDAAIQGITPAPAPAPMRAQTALPENQGIARIPAPNIKTLADGGIAGYGDEEEEGMATGGMGGMFNFAQQSEPVMRMAGGGMAGYMPGFNKTGAVNAAFEAAFQKTLGYEGGYVENDAGKGPSNFGINKAANPDIDVKGLTKEKARELYKKRYWDAIGGDALAAKNPALATVAFDTAVNMGVGKANQLVTEAKGDPSTLLGLRQQHYDSLVKKDPEKFAPYAKGWKERVADLATSVIPSAEAGTLPKPQAAAPVDTSLAAQIPGQRYQAPPVKEPGGFLSSDWFERQAENLGMSRDVGRNVANTLNAPTPLAPATGMAKTGSSLSGLPGLAEKIGTKLGFAKTPGRLTEAEVLALQKESQGLRSLEAGQQATKGAQEAGATLEEQDYLRKMIEARQAKEAPSAAQKIAEASQAREAADMATAQRLSQVGQEAQAAGRTSAIADRVMPTATPTSASPFKDDPFNREPVSPDEFGTPPELPEVPDLSKKDVVEAAKEATPVKERKGFSNDDLLTLGLNLLASKSPNFMTALGEAGLATVAGKKEREKTEREEDKLKGLEELQKAQAKYYTSYGEAIDRGAKEKNEELLAEKAITDYMEKWDKAMPNKVAGISDPGLRQRTEEAYRQKIFAQMGIKPIMSQQPTASSGSGGFKLLGVR